MSGARLRFVAVQSWPGQPWLFRPRPSPAADDLRLVQPATIRLTNRQRPFTLVMGQKPTGNVMTGDQVRQRLSRGRAAIKRRTVTAMTNLAAAGRGHTNQPYHRLLQS